MRRTWKIPKLILTAMLLLFVTNVICQDLQKPNTRHRAEAGFGFTFIPLAGELEDTDARGLFIPAVRLDYFFCMLPRWEIGFMGNYEIDHYMIVDEEIEIDHAVVLSLVGMFKITDHLGVFTGGGAEISPQKTQGVFRLGTEYTIDLRKNFALVPKLFLDFRGNYLTWSAALTVAKKF
jgi:hypothetical protein